jgi:hypothetical protein
LDTKRTIPDAVGGAFGAGVGYSVSGMLPVATTLPQTIIKGAAIGGSAGMTGANAQSGTSQILANGRIDPQKLLIDTTVGGASGAIIGGAIAGLSWTPKNYNNRFVPCEKANGGAGRANPSNVKVHQGQQDKHIPGTNNYNQDVANGVNRSTLNANSQQLLDDFAGTGTSMGGNKEWVDFGKTIGQYYDINTGTYIDTIKGIIHYNSSGGAHIVPSNPLGIR